MKRYCAVVIVCLIGGLNVRADEAPKSAEVKKLAAAMIEATKKGDYAKVIDHTYPAVVEMLGGRQKAINNTETAMKTIKAQGLEIKNASSGDPGEFYTEGKNTFVIIPTKMELTFPMGIIRTKSYLLGISPDDGKTWTFLDGSGLQNLAIRDKVLPKMPEKLKLPENEKPEIVKD
ncbi:hypothetical protein [Zavarzinella formosa]|uniref:hypothetical protein n=1 Tax=Zavarzinella formosa TaxID=360055 RepID=UPI0002F626F2|nr:hypothetical protein [Zavarzinella formosa]